MTKQGHVGTIELFSIVTIVQVIPVFYSLPNLLAERVQTGAWLLQILINFLGFILFVPIYLLLKNFPGKSIIDIAQYLMGNIGRTLVSLLLGGYYFYTFVHFLRVFGEAVINTALLATPLYAILVLAIMPPMLIAYLGLESLTRTSLIFAPIIGLGILMIIVLTLPDVNFDAIYPLLGKSLLDHGKNALELAPVVHGTLFLAIWAPYFRKEKGMFSLVLVVFVLTMIIATSVVILTELCFPYPDIKLIPLPIYQIARIIYVGRFVQRIEALVLIMAIVTTQLHICAMFSTSVLAFAQGWKLTDWRPIIFPLAVTGFALAFIAHDLRELAAWYYSVPNSIISAGVSVFLPIILYTLWLFKGKKGGENAENQTN
ncbi:MAG TPA: GerAB/ArcD/ProY family transporter [Candidatus Deferrimicrobium sp.]|nr:GerAB/ArcD/ProY family transporter [Candidatus Deferrimicrobium sp.]